MSEKEKQPIIFYILLPLFLIVEIICPLTSIRLITFAILTIITIVEKTKYPKNVVITIVGIIITLCVLLTIAIFVYGIAIVVYGLITGTNGWNSFG